MTISYFKENILFEEYKDTLLKGPLALKQEIKKKYDYEVSNDLYRRIVNYQIKKYGKALHYCDVSKREYIKDFHLKTVHLRKATTIRTEELRKEKAFINKLEEKRLKSENN